MMMPLKGLNDLIHKYNLPVTGTSYYGDMWDKNQQQNILRRY